MLEECVGADRDSRIGSGDADEIVNVDISGIFVAIHHLRLSVNQINLL